MFGPSADSFFTSSFVDQIRQNLSPAARPFLVAVVLAVIFVPVAIQASRRLGVIDHPGDGRRIHRQATPLLGGAAMYAAFAVAIFLSSGTASLQGVLLLGAAATAILIIDDKWGMSAVVKLSVQLGLSLAAMLGPLPWLHDLITYLSLPYFGTVHLHWLAFPLTLFWLMGMQNAVNLLDGVDGLAAGVVAIVSVTLMIAAAGKGQTDVVVATAALTGVCLGFLVFNFNPARIFMGDSGSHFLGLTLALLSILGVAKVAVGFALLVPAIALGIPIVDTLTSILRRRRRGDSIAHPDSEHIHHQLLDFGLSQRETCMVIYAATAILGAVGLMLFGHRRILAVVIVFLVVVASTVLGERLQHSTKRVKGRFLKRVLATD
ncbi:MAG TPA: MraY family glycosyltransferase [Candidatus Dormibacteraeota bacterium]|nr:MraY family glycosyltransferase [Candidatus Dormibacteraeota bacterium]